MTSKEENLTDARHAGPPAIVSASVPLNSRLAHEIPKPIDHQAFQRLCVLLFCAELQDPAAQEYGWNGQGQGGIDILGRRDGRYDYYVGIQCRRIDKPDKENVEPGPFPLHTRVAAARKQAGQPISQFDAQIAAIALANGGNLATRNEGDFKGCGVSVVNPWQV